MQANKKKNHTHIIKKANKTVITLLGKLDGSYRVDLKTRLHHKTVFNSYRKDGSFFLSFFFLFHSEIKIVRPPVFREWGLKLLCLNRTCSPWLRKSNTIRKAWDLIVLMAVSTNSFSKKGSGIID